MSDKEEWNTRNKKDSMWLMKSDKTELKQNENIFLNQHKVQPTYL